VVLSVDETSVTYRIRKMTQPNPAADYAGGDMTFGQSGANFFVDNPQAVGQRCATRLGLYEGQWYLDLFDGTPWFQEILQQRNIGLAEAALLSRIQNTPFVLAGGVTNVSVTFNSQTRAFSLSGDVATAFGKFYFVYPVNQNQIGPFWIGLTPLGQQIQLG
jgi:hypothetical protein